MAYPVHFVGGPWDGKTLEVQSLWAELHLVRAEGPEWLAGVEKPPSDTPIVVYELRNGNYHCRTEDQ